MFAREDALTKLTPFDRVMLSLMGLLIILVLGAVIDAPFWQSAAAAAVFILGVNVYGQLSRPRDIPPPTLTKDKSGAKVFNQRAIADNLTEAVWIINTREQIIYSNSVAEKLFGPTLTGRRLTTVMRDPSMTQLVHTALQGENAEPVDYHASAPINRHFRVTATAINLGDKESEPEHFAMLVFSDVTDLLKFTQTQSDFLANASHELKTPIASLLGYIETLRGHAKDDPKARERFLIIMQEQAERMERLISDLLSLRQIEQSEHIAPDSAADLRAAANFAIDTVLPLAKARGVTVDIEGLASLQVKGHQDELVQLCLNIIDNAIKMTPQGGSVTLNLSQVQQWRTPSFVGFEKTPNQSNRQIVRAAPAAQGYGVLSIQDNGPGFAPQHIPRLGERFYRIAGDRRSKDKGTGLGLAIVKHLVVRHRGGLIVSSIHHPETETTGQKKIDADTGTTFTVVLPLKV